MIYAPVGDVFLVSATSVGECEQAVTRTLQKLHMSDTWSVLELQKC